MNGAPEEDSNRLANSRSPYLLQHASNPVAWREWGEEAFAEARRRDLPIFLSIGYSTCHWCHVMAHESFEDPEIAKLQNDCFVNVKLDREERPDVDRIYMAYVQATTGSGGWPMSVWLTPDLKPFYGGTYFPPEDRYGRIGFRSLIQRIHVAWTEQRETLLEVGEKSAGLLMRDAESSAGALEADALKAVATCIDQLSSSFDERWGGFDGPPKFPMAANLQLLLQACAADRSEVLVRMLTRTLDRMASGGMWDHLGGGFHRYSVDEYWHVPHYEKMLYDQGQLAEVYAQAFCLTGREEYRRVAREIAAYLGRDLLGEQGQFFAAEDADSPDPRDPSESKEGAFYVWSRSELSSLLGADSGLFEAAFDVQEGGNARPESDPHGELLGLNTLARVRSLADLAAAFRMTEESVSESLARSCSILFEARLKRPRPHLDDKAIVSWNGLAISGICKTYQVSGDSTLLQLANRAGDFIWNEMRQEDGSLRRVYRLGLGNASGFAEDYAAAANGFLDLYESSFDVVWLERSRLFLDQLRSRFEDAQRGGFFASEAGDASLIVRLRDDYDGAEPAASSLAALAFWRLAMLTDRSEYLDAARRTVDAFAGQWSRSPRSMPLMLTVASRLASSGQQIVIVGRRDDSLFAELLAVAGRSRKPGSVLIALDSGKGLEGEFEGNEKLQAMLHGFEGAAAYVCEDYICQAPVHDVENLRLALQR